MGGWVGGWGCIISRYVFCDYRKGTISNTSSDEVSFYSSQPRVAMKSEVLIWNSCAWRVSLEIT